MKFTTLLTVFFISAVLSVAGCVSKTALIVDPGTVPPGSKVTKNGAEIALTGNAIELGQRVPVTDLVEAKSMKATDLQTFAGSVLILSIVPSIDTKVCEQQTHYLGEQGDALPSSIKRLTISRDTPFAQMRFAEAAKLTDIMYLSDYKEGSFGKAFGLLLDGPMLLARSVIVVDKKGVVRYIQVVPELTHLPDMNRAFQKAMELDLE